MLALSFVNKFSEHISTINSYLTGAVNKVLGLITHCLLWEITVLFALCRQAASIHPCLTGGSNS